VGGTATVGGRALPGIALVGLIALIALEIGTVPWLLAHGISALTLGMLAGNTIYPRLAGVAHVSRSPGGRALAFSDSIGRPRC